VNPETKMTAEKLRRQLYMNTREFPAPAGRYRPPPPSPWAQIAVAIRPMFDGWFAAVRALADAIVPLTQRDVVLNEWAPGCDCHELTDFTDDIPAECPVHGGAA
jgi:hypothetical protein